MVADDLKENVPLQKEAKVSMAPTELKPWPEFIQKRIDMWDRLMAEYKAELAQKKPTPIKITLPDGKQFDAEAWRTTPLQIAEKISKGLAENTVIAKVNGDVWDLDRPFEGDATLHLLKFDDDEAKQVFWHSSAHILGEAMERYCGGHLCYGPPIEEGFYYDMWHDNLTISQDDFPNIDQIVKCAIKDKQPFERLEMTKEDLLEMFKYNEFKTSIEKYYALTFLNFRFEVEKEQFGLKPMNCPGHCLMYSHQPRTHNELPIRYADFGVLHRNEMSGALTGLIRVRRFQQDDAHIFCRRDQIWDEIKGCLDFLSFCYEKVFGFTFKLNLATRPEGFLGELSTWDEAESDLKAALNESGRPWKLNEGDGAFYGPKIDISIQDALKRNHQCATIQLDFQLPQRFDLSYFDEKGEKQRPVMIHRAVLGSVERMAAILTENYGGKWPFWLSPRQAKVITVHESVNSYARQVKEKLYNAGFEVEFDEGCPDTLNKQIRNAQLAQFNFILVVGQKEVEHGTVNVRTRDNAVRGEVSVDDLLAKFRRFAEEYVKDTENAEEFSKGISANGSE
ncbi:threonine--tRNA ligase [Teladorsagia circumcincta]|uniref:threonine--tRNA ligase n=1 Tax=Teladorsagia circumcincta TaxID=45464 RepID=A0A2G9U815_TELCI|nr:threonine--tRNA ligase [Teladorsagia circumcincta]